MASDKRDVADTGVDGSSRRLHDNPLQPLITRLGQKLHKHRSKAEQYGFQFMPFVSSYNGQMRPDPVSFVCSQIDHKLRLVDTQVAAAKRKSTWKLWVRHISAARRVTSTNAKRKITKKVNLSSFAQR